MEGLQYTLYAVDIPQKDLAPKPPLPNAILDKVDRCYELDSPPTGPEGLEAGGQLIKVDPNRDRMQNLISNGCAVALDWRQFGYPNDGQKDADGKPIRLWLSTRRFDPTQPDKADPDVPPSSNKACNDILKSVLSSCEYKFPVILFRPMFFL